MRRTGIDLISLDRGSAAMTVKVHVGGELLADEVMSSPVQAVSDTSPIWDAWNIAVTKDIHHVAVVSGDHCVGVVTDRQLMDAWHHGPGVLRTTPIKHLLLGRTSCVLPDAPLRQAANLMSTEHVDAVPVVDETGRLLGLITAGDIVQAVAQHGITPAHRGSS
jgi:CBS domain-containing protein